MADPMKIRASLQGEFVEVKVLMSHVMETGRRLDEESELVPAHYITRVTVECNGRSVLVAHWGAFVSRDPYLAFKFKGGAAGEKVKVTWEDSKGETRTDEATVA